MESPGAGSPRYSPHSSYYPSSSSPSPYVPGPYSPGHIPVRFASPQPPDVLASIEPEGDPLIALQEAIKTGQLALRRVRDEVLRLEDVVEQQAETIAGLEASLARSQEIAAAYHAELETRPLPPTPSPPPFSPVTPPPPPKKRRRREASLLGPVDPETGRGAKRACKVARNYHE